MHYVKWPPGVKDINNVKVTTCMEFELNNYNCCVTPEVPSIFEISIFERNKKVVIEMADKDSGFYLKLNPADAKILGRAILHYGEAFNGNN